MIENPTFTCRLRH